jgi:hypothetical protein
MYFALYFLLLSHSGCLFSLSYLFENFAKFSQIEDENNEELKKIMKEEYDRSERKFTKKLKSKTEQIFYLQDDKHIINEVPQNEKTYE